MSIPNIIQHLLDTYDNVTPSELDQLQQQIRDIHFNPTEPVDTIFTRIEDFSDVAKIAPSPISRVHKINMAYLILQKAIKFKSDLKACNHQNQTQKTWPNSKVFLEKHKKSSVAQANLQLRKR
eukprot:673900-Ditylum_brightwellii.AAC.4